jgi:hypothetical protein
MLAHLSPVEKSVPQKHGRNSGNLQKLTCLDNLHSAKKDKIIPCCEKCFTSRVESTLEISGATFSSHSSSQRELEPEFAAPL